MLTLRTRADSDVLRTALARDERWVIIGAGWIGLEVAAAARSAGRPVTVLEYGPLPLQRVLGERSWVAISPTCTAATASTSGPACPCGPSSGAGHGLGVRVGDEVIAPTRSSSAVGVAPNSELATAAGLAVDNGIVVDQRLRTGDPHVLAAGDVAAADNTALGRRLRVEHWDNAIRQGRLAAGTILGLPRRVRLAALLLHRPVRPRHGVRRRARPRRSAGRPRLLPGGEFVAFWLAATTASPRR